MTTVAVDAAPQGSTRTVRVLEALFVASGFCGLIYESIWSHYLKLFLGHAAYAQSLVLIVFIGGMAFGAWAAGKLSHRIRYPLLAYAAVELAVGVGSLVFHGVYLRTTEWTLETVLPLACSPEAPCALQWGIASLLILPQSILLGTTFPLMTSAVLRLAPGLPGRRIANLYFFNSIGAVFGVLCSGFYLIPTVGLPGTLLTAGLLNISVALAVYFCAKAAGATLAPLPATGGGVASVRQARVVLVVAGLTGLSSFVYEVVWIRMLSLVIGASTHAFEVMLAAFILGLALGGWWIRSRIDRIGNLMVALAIVQVLMGVFAVATLPLYDATFDLLGWTIGSLNRSEGGYTLYNLTSQVIAMAVMLPATFLAGMTLPLITAGLIKSGFGERAIGYVYAANTVGAILGVMIAVHLALPLLGVKSALIAAAAVDVAIGAWLFFGEREGTVARSGYAWVGLGTMALVATALLADLPPERLASGVFRHGQSRLDAGREVVFHRDGKTATVSVFRDRQSRVMIATNGKIDASMSSDTEEPAADEHTMVMTGLLPLLYRPELKKAAVIGFGSGMTTATLLGSPLIERVDTIEIEREMAEGARLFGSRVERAFADPRSRIIFDDAKSYFARGHEKFDAIVSEPSNPWVSGVASLFTVEFYRRVKSYLTDDGLLVQWIQTYEISDELVATILRSIHAEFADYALFASQPGDMILVASQTRLPSRLRADALAFPGLAYELKRLHFENLDEFEVRRLASRSTVAALLSQQGRSLNSDFYPIVDTHAPRARFMHAQATAFTQLPAAPLPLVEILEEQPGDSVPTRFTGDGPMVGRRGEVVEARAFARWFIDGNTPSVDPPEVTLLAREGTIARAQLWNCASAAPNTNFIESLAFVAGQLNTHLPKAEAAGVWSAVEAAPCYPRLTPEQKRWLALFRAVGTRFPNAMATIGRELLASGSDLSSDLREYATLAAATGLVKTGRNGEARELLDQQLAKLPADRRVLPWFLMVRGMALDERSSTNSRLAPVADRGR